MTHTQFQIIILPFPNQAILRTLGCLTDPISGRGDNDFCQVSLPITSPQFFPMPESLGTPRGNGKLTL